jgi:hypothetical protein
MISKTLSPENQLKIRCPVFPAETRIAGCFLLRDLVYRGDAPPDKRAGCQCAIMASKCPIPTLVKRMVREGVDEYHSAEPQVRDFDNDLLDQTGRVLVTDKMMRRYALTSGEEKALVQANENARSYVDKKVKKPRREERVMKLEDVEAPKTATPAPTDASELVKAAQSGDMAAAINAETGK